LNFFENRVTTGSIGTSRRFTCGDDEVVTNGEVPQRCVETIFAPPNPLSKRRMERANRKNLKKRLHPEKKEELQEKGRRTAEFHGRLKHFRGGTT